MEALDRLHHSLLELIAILDKTKVGPNISEDLMQNVERLFEYVTLRGYSSLQYLVLPL